MVAKALANNILFDWVGGDGLYGHNYELCTALETRHLLFVLDIHKDQRIYLEEYTVADFAFFQAQRYWVERNFDDGKNELGMSDYQVRKWKGWHHHHAIVLMAMLFMLKEQIDKELDYPLMSLGDARKMVMALIAQSIVAPQSPVKEEIKRMKNRHFKRKKSTDWYFNNDPNSVKNLEDRPC